MMFTQDEVRRRVVLDHATGEFTWLPREVLRPQDKTWNRRHAGKTVGVRRSDGYVSVGLNNRRILGHRLVWLYLYGEWPPNHIDHINRVKWDNRPENLRLATVAENTNNCKIRKNNTSGFKGVSFNKRIGRWVASIRHSGARHFLGVFDSAELAAEAYNAVADVEHGAFR
jgi:hypothetical protein